MLRPVFLIIALTLSFSAFSKNNISINGSEEVLNEELLKLTLSDVKQLLEKAFDAKVSFNNANAQIQINLPSPEDPRFKKIEYLNGDSSQFYYPDCGYEWNSSQEGILSLDLSARSYEGISAALYGLLQEKLGFSFYHPRASVIPEHTSWPLEKNFSWQVKERFKKRGFMIHTMHPLELTEPLLDPEYPNALEIVKEYIDWLARNGQNYFGLRLLKTIKLKQWISHAKEITDYAHSRGVFMGLNLYANQIQQKAFRLYYDPALRLKSRVKQTMSKLDQLEEANFDVYFIEMSTNEKNMGDLEFKANLIDRIYLHCLKHNIFLFAGAVKHNFDGTSTYYNGVDSLANRHLYRGESAHTFMFYGLTDSIAPIYNYKNLLHKTAHLLKWKDTRETWYHPESAYWVTFDNTVPMLLLPYFKARLDDIKFCDSVGVVGHHTFSSGWEWGYGLIDWSIARWSWDYGNELYPSESLDKLISNEKIKNALTKLMADQEYYIKKKQLIRYLCAQTVTDEMPGKNMQFHPQPHWKYKYLFRKANLNELDSLKRIINELENLKSTFSEMTKTIEQESSDSEGWSEIQAGINITYYRVMHRIEILEAIRKRRLSKINNTKTDEVEHHLQKAREIRGMALRLVKNVEQNIYRYDINQIGRKRKGHTAYHFGYLYPVSNLHFWEREERQIQKNRWGFLHRNIWNIPRIIGLW
jgi:hypothetical protein